MSAATLERAAKEKVSEREARRQCPPASVLFDELDLAEPNMKLDGPGITAWLVEVGVLGTGHDRAIWSDKRMRRVSDWRRGGRASVAMVDEMLSVQGIGLWEIPDELWVDAKGQVKAEKGTKAEAVARIQAGETSHAIAERYGFHESTVRYWVKQANR